MLARKPVRGLLTNIILGMAVRREGAKKPKKKNGLLVWDEFVRLGRMEKLIVTFPKAGWLQFRSQARQHAC